jgi:glucosamine--fructose-6-phosphate aminotransferase (isomerizing)
LAYPACHTLWLEAGCISWHIGSLLAADARNATVYLERLEADCHPARRPQPMHNCQSWMAKEIKATPTIVERQESALARPLGELLRRIRRKPPNIVLTCARGSSAHAATFGKHLIERYSGLPVAAAAPSIASIYNRPLKLRGQLLLAISQSGRSDDLIAFAAGARKSGALTVAITNDIEAPLAATCDIVLPIEAGPERSIAATKTFVAMAAVLLRLTAAWAEDGFLDGAMCRLPQRLERASALDWSSGAEFLSQVEHLATIGRGSTLAIAREAALKLKEICNLPTEAFSGAEFLHGPIALVRPRYPVLMFVPTDAAATSMRHLVRDLTLKDADLVVADAEASFPRRLPVLPPDQPETDALCLIQSFYAMTVALADRLGIDVDKPRNLQKVTRTR